MSADISTSPKPGIGRRSSALPASRLREKLAARNGSRHSVYWVQPKKGASKSLSYANVVECASIAAAANEIEYSRVGKYTGDWKDGQKHGYGVLLYANGNKYEGEWERNKRHGRGVYWIDNRNKLRKQYAGDWYNGHRHGDGICYYDDGGKYEGKWLDNKRHGHGRMIYGKDQSVYEGEWLHNERSGRGTLVLVNGDCYDGCWLNDKKEGPGRYFYKAIRKLYEGEWVDDAPKCGTYFEDTEFSLRDGDLDDSESHHTFQLPEVRVSCCVMWFEVDLSLRSCCKQLELAHPEQVVNERVAGIRRDRTRQQAFIDAADDDDDDDVFDADAATRCRSMRMSATDMEPDVIVLDEPILRAIQSEFDALLAAESTETAHKQPVQTCSGCISCSLLPRLINVLRLNVSDEQLADLLQEIGATYDTLVSFDEVVDILSLLMES